MDEHALPPPPPDLLTGAALFLDFDGTLVDLAPVPDAVRVDPALPALLTALAARLEGRLAIVTGRPVDVARGFLGLDGLAYAGSHGLELRHADGRSAAPAAPDWLAEASAAADTLAAAHDGFVVERKPFGLGLHFRLAPDAEGAAGQLAERLAAAHGAHVQPGKMMVEVHIAGADKGSAIDRFMAEAPFAGARAIFAGDDLTDEAGFVAVAARGGAGILIGAARATAARYRVDDVAALRRWLEGQAA